LSKGKYQEWLEPEKLLLIRAWARDGLTDEQIAHNIGVRRETLYAWMKAYPNISNALKKGKEVVDVEVENALFQKTQGYTVEIKKTFKCKEVDYDPVTGKKIAEREVLKTGSDEVYVPADTTAQIFWLKNRKPDTWGDKQELNLNGSVTISGEDKLE
jgi:DNA-binding XRE family transcriptional regulator